MSVRQTRYRSWKRVPLRGSSHPVIRLRNRSRISVDSAVVSETSEADFEPRTIASVSMGANQSTRRGRFLNFRTDSRELSNPGDAAIQPLARMIQSCDPRFHQLTYPFGQPGREGVSFVRVHGVSLSSMTRLRSR